MSGKLVRNTTCGFWIAGSNLRGLNSRKHIPRGSRDAAPRITGRVSSFLSLLSLSKCFFLSLTWPDRGPPSFVWNKCHPPTFTSCDFGNVSIKTISHLKNNDIKKGQIYARTHCSSSRRGIRENDGQAQLKEIKKNDKSMTARRVKYHSSKYESSFVFRKKGLGNLQGPYSAVSHASRSFVVVNGRLSSSEAAGTEIRLLRSRRLSTLRIN